MSTKIQTAHFSKHVYFTHQGISVPGLLEQFEPFIGSQVDVKIDRADGLRPQPDRAIAEEPVHLRVTMEFVDETAKLREENAELKRRFFNLGIPV